MLIPSMIGRFGGAAGDDDSDTGSSQDMPVCPAAPGGSVVDSPLRVSSPPIPLHIQEGIMPEHTHTPRVSEQPGPSGRPTIPPLEELERQTEEALAGRHSATGSQAGPSVPNPRRQAQLAAETIQTLRENVSLLSEVSERTGSVASSSHRRSHQAM